MQKKLLIIEDDLGIVEASKELFESLDYEVQCATDVAEVLASFNSGFVPDVIITDYSIPGLSAGEDIVSIIRSKIKHADTSIILVSGNAEIKKIALERDVNFLEKPFDIDVLIDRVEAGSGSRL